MYPATFFGLFPVFPRTNRAFVAMSFDKAFDARWKDVLMPALASIRIKEQPLEPHRIDLSKAGDSVLTQILDEISHCRIVLADITALHDFDGRPIRNENVFYEMALAHAVRLPEEVLIFRSDTMPLAFDISNVRVHQYDPDKRPEEARKMIVEMVNGALKELDLRRHLAIRRASEAASEDTFIVLAGASKPGGMSRPDRKTMAQVLVGGPQWDAISQLLEVGAIRTEFFKLTPETAVATFKTLRDGDTSSIRYRTTAFGAALYACLREQMGLHDPQVQAQLAAVRDPKEAQP